jgi:hypothetical protein
LGDSIKEDEMGGACKTHRLNGCILDGNLERKRPFGRPRYRCKNINMDIKETGFEEAG